MRLARRAGVSFRAMSAIRPLVIRNRSPSTFNNLAFTSGFCLTRCQKSFRPSTPTCEGSSARAYSSWVRSINDAIPNIVPARTTSKVSSCPPTMPYKRILPVSNRKTASDASPRAYTVSPLPKARSRVLWTRRSVCSDISGSNTSTIERSLTRSARDSLLFSIAPRLCWLLRSPHMLASSWVKGIDARGAAVGGSNVAEGIKRVLVVANHNAFWEAVAMPLNQEEDLEVASRLDSRYSRRTFGRDRPSVGGPLLARRGRAGADPGGERGQPERLGPGALPQARPGRVPPSVGGRCARGTRHEHGYRGAHRCGKEIGGHRVVMVRNPSRPGSGQGRR